MVSGSARSLMRMDSLVAGWKRLGQAARSATGFTEARHRPRGGGTMDWKLSCGDPGVDVDAPRRSTSRRPASTPDHDTRHRPAAVRAAHAAGIELLDRPRHRYHRVGPWLRAAAARGLGRPRRPCGAGRARGRRERRPGLRLGLVRLLRRSGRATAGRSSSYPHGPSPRKDDATARRAP